MERREKVEEARRETERILAEQEAEVARRKVCGGSRCCDSHVLQQRLATAKGTHGVSTNTTTCFITGPVISSRQALHAPFSLPCRACMSSCAGTCWLQKAMEERDAERIKRMAVEAAERTAANAAKKKKAVERIAGDPSHTVLTPVLTSKPIRNSLSQWEKFVRAK